MTMEHLFIRTWIVDTLIHRQCGTLFLRSSSTVWASTASITRTRHLLLAGPEFWVTWRCEPSQDHPWAILLFQNISIWCNISRYFHNICQALNWSKMCVISSKIFPRSVCAKILQQILCFCNKNAIFKVLNIKNIVKIHMYHNTYSDYCNITIFQNDAIYCIRDISRYKTPTLAQDQPSIVWSAVTECQWPINSPITLLF